MSEQHHDGHDEHDHGSTFVKVFVALLILTAISFLVGNSPLMVNRPQVGWALMLVVSCAKALLVISFFMHLRWEANWKYVLTIPASIMSLFVLVMLIPDVAQRSQYLSEERFRHSATPEVNEAQAGHADHSGNGGHSKEGEHGHDNGSPAH